MEDRRGEENHRWWASLEQKPYGWPLPNPGKEQREGAEGVEKYVESQSHLGKGSLGMVVG